ncbi:MAG TPA: BBP7 family outer membrane beta-barrel protein [Planctomycetaceae bacterium]|nr:BBP7 family outer membrane beta-barrel protein [Planctomycetaceae bacterium]
MAPPSPYGTPAPISQPAEWYGDQDEIVAATAPYGPQRIFDGGFLRAEYLNWNIGNPGNQTLGAPLLGVGDVTQPFYVYTPGSQNIQAIASVPTTFPISLSDVNGVRVTGGMDLLYGGSIEISAFMLGKKSSGFNVTKFPEIGVVNADDPTSLHLVTQGVATSVLNHGQIGNDVYFYNQSYSAVYTSQLWGAEGNYIGDYDRDGFIQINPTAGLRFFQLHERLTQVGVFKDTILDAPAVTTTIDSMTFNNLYGGQIGTRIELVTQYVQLGVDPKLMFLANTMLASVTTNHLRSNNDGVVYTDDLTTGFSFGVDIPVFAQINFNDRFSVRVGYNFIWINAVTRPENNVYYNTNGPNNPPGVVTSLDRKDFIVQGVSIGATLKF